MRIQVRGEGDSARSLNVKGEEIYEILGHPRPYKILLLPGRFHSYLVRCITDTNIKVRQLRLDHIPQHDLQSLLLRLPLHSFRDLGRHSRIEFHGDDSFCPFEDFDSQVPRSGPYFENDVALLQVGFVDYGLCDSGVAENVLA